MSAHEHEDILVPVVRAMRENLTAGLTLGDMADVACLSPFHFHRQFQRFMGVSPGHFFTALRMDAAKRLLLTTTESAVDICYAIGYSSPGTFTTRFAHLVGATPSAFRALPQHCAELSLFEAEASLVLSSLEPPGGMGTIYGPEGFRGLLFVGAFSSRVPQARPLAGVLLKQPGPYGFPCVADGRYHVMVAAIPAGDPQSLYLPGDGLLVGAGSQPLVIAQGRLVSAVDVRLRRPADTDPPIVIALPLLLPRPSASFR